MRFRLRTLLIALALAPVAFASGYWLWQSYNPPPDPHGVVIVDEYGFWKDGVVYRVKREYRRDRTIGVTIRRADGEAMPPEGD